MAGLQIKPAASRWPRLSLPIVLFGFWLSLVAVHEVLVPAHLEFSLCLTRNLTGYPCPTCGTTRLCLAAARGDVFAAFRFNPLMFIVIGIAIALLILRLGYRRVIQIDLTRRQQIIAIAAGLALLALNWGWVIWYHVADAEA